MKKLIFAVLMLLVPSIAFGVGTCTETFLGRSTIVIGGISYTGTTYVVKIACVGDGATGAFPDEAITNYGGDLVAVFMDWGAVAPDTGTYDIYVKLDSVANADLLGGAGVNLATAADLWITPAIGAVSVPAPSIGAITLSQAGNTQASATTNIYLFYKL